MTELSVTTRIVGDECVLALTGEIDMLRADKLGDLGVGTLQSHNIRRLTVDLAAVTFIDSTGLGALVRMHQAASVQDKHFSLRNPSDAVRKLLSLSGLDALLPIETSPDTELGSGG